MSSSLRIKIEEMLEHCKSDSDIKQALYEENPVLITPRHLLEVIRELWEESHV